MACDGSGSCKIATGEACGGNGDCASNHCFDAACCDANCNATCYSCALPGSEGTCTPIPALGTDTGCTGANACDGAGACKLANGQTCQQASQCASGNCATSCMP
jgi:hypothetical protein